MNENELTTLLFNKICGKQYFMIGKVQVYLPIYYTVKDEKAKLGFLKKEKLPDSENVSCPDMEPTIEINNFELFKKKLYEYVEKFISSRLRWTFSGIRR